MALDEVFLGRVASGYSAPVLRVYSWSSPTVSLGYNQDLRRELDPQLCRQFGVQMVRRPTGGRSVYHSHELTYSVAAPGDTDWLGRTLGESYNLVAQGILRALTLLGVEPESLRAPPKLEPQGFPRLAHPCFTSTTRHEITVWGRKLVGSAQRRLGTGGAFLQQGSLLFSNTQAHLAELMPENSRRREQARLAHLLSSRVIGLEEILKRKVDFEEAAQAFLRGFEETFGCSFIVSEPTKEEITLARRLEKLRYKRREWLYNKETLREEEIGFLNQTINPFEPEP